MANGIASGLEGLLGIDTTAGNAQLQQALQALQAVNVPTAQQLDLPTLQKYVQAGVLTPQQYQAIQENPQVYSNMVNQVQTNTGENAQKAALQQLGGIVSAGGSTPINQANLVNNINTTNQAMQAARQGIQENAQERGVAGGGQELLSQLMNEQGNAQTANTNAVNSAASNAQLALSALSQQGQLGGQVQSEEQQNAQAQAQAAQQIAQYNSQLQSAANQYNTQTANSAQAANLQNAQNVANQNTGLANYQTEYNAQVPQTVFQDTMSKAQQEANQYQNQAQLAEQQAQQQAQFTGGLLGAGATLGGDYMLGQGISGAGGGKAVSGALQNTAAATPQMSNPYDQVQSAGSTYAPMAQGGEVKCYAQGGEVHDHSLCMKAGGPVPGTPQVPGNVDTTKNDTVPARLSPHEIVLPRSVTQSPNPVGNAAQFVAGIKGQPAPLSFADIIKKLEENGLELRLGSK